MSLGFWLALVASVVVLTGLGLASFVLVKLDDGHRLRRLKIDARIGRWFGLTIQMEREPGREIRSPLGADGLQENQASLNLSVAGETPPDTSRLGS